MAREIEAKIKVTDLDAVRARLDDLGASNEGECLERNWVLDDIAGNLKQNGILLRVRNMGGTGGILTVKYRVEENEFKAREEVETMTDSTDELLQQFLIIGYKVDWIYEKYRQTWLWRDCILALDECPEIGFFVEIEGSPERIREVAYDIGLNPEDHIDDNYLGLWIKHLNSLGQDKRHMIFSEADHAKRRHKTERFVIE